MINIAIMGHGVVGSGVVEVLLHNHDGITSRAAEEINIKHILDLREFPDSPLSDRFTKDFNDILNDESVKIVVETMGGVKPAYDFVKSCLLAGKSVVTSNKELVAKHGQELVTIAKENNLNFLFEASVGGGIPIIRPMTQCLAANKICDVIGILNGTTNFIMTKMIKDNTDFKEALAIAQQLGYAEKDPTADVEGHDACRKIAILSSLAFGKYVNSEDIQTEGITKITLDDVKYASIWGGVIKLIGKVKKLENNMIDIVVAPMFVPYTSQLSSIEDVFNGIMVRGDCTGDVVFYGKGAGKLPTASAVVADVVDCVKHLKNRKYLFWADSDNSSVIDYKESVTAMYIRAKADDRDAAYNKAKEIFRDIHILENKDAAQGEIAFVCEPMKYSDILNNIDTLNADGIKVESAIRIGDL